MNLLQKWREGVITTREFRKALEVFSVETGVAGMGPKEEVIRCSKCGRREKQEPARMMR